MGFQRYTFKKPKYSQNANLTKKICRLFNIIYQNKLYNPHREFWSEIEGIYVLDIKTLLILNKNAFDYSYVKYFLVIFG